MISTAFHSINWSAVFDSKAVRSFCKERKNHNAGLFSIDKAYVTLTNQKQTLPLKQFGLLYTVYVVSIMDGN
jgi:hypothetical protein